MSLKDDLIAAKALIDTPAKLEALGIVGAIKAASPLNTTAAIRSLQLAGIVGHFRNHPLVMSAFDRAIAAADMNAKPQVKP